MFIFRLEMVFLYLSVAKVLNEWQRVSKINERDVNIPFTCCIVMNFICHNFCMQISDRWSGRIFDTFILVDLHNKFELQAKMINDIVIAFECHFVEFW